MRKETVDQIAQFEKGFWDYIGLSEILSGDLSLLNDVQILQLVFRI